MKLHYYKDTDSLYTDLAPASSSDSKEIAEGLVIDFDETGHVVGIDIQHASERIDLSEITAVHLPLVAQVA
jgi:uncharacterized protein YuzE